METAWLIELPFFARWSLRSTLNEGLVALWVPLGALGRPFGDLLGLFRQLL